MATKTKAVGGLLFTTSDYSMFVSHDNNRPISARPALKKSMQTYGFMPSRPIQVRKLANGKLGVTSGHHRLYYAQLLKIPVYYVIDPLCSDLYYAEKSSRPWSMSDYVTSYASAGKDDYRQLMFLHEQSGIPLSLIAALAADCPSCISGGIVNTIAKGTWKIDPEAKTHMQNVLDVVAIAAKTLDFAKTSNFVRSISRAVAIKEVSVQQLSHAFSNHGHTVKRCATIDDYMEEIESLYNRFKRGPLVPIKLYAKQMMLKTNQQMRKKNVDQQSSRAH